MHAATIFALDGILTHQLKRIFIQPTLSNVHVNEHLAAFRHQAQETNDVGRKGEDSRIDAEAVARAADSYSGRGKFETDNGLEVRAAALPEVRSDERRFPSIALKWDLVIRSCE